MGSHTAAAAAASAGAAACPGTAVRRGWAVHLESKDARHIRAASQMRKLLLELHDQQVRKSGTKIGAVQLVRRRMVSINVEYFMASRTEQLDITLVGEVASADRKKFSVVAVDYRAATEVALSIFAEL